jgi:hypothetical protein
MKLIGRITKGQPVYTTDDADAATVAFAKAYLASNRGPNRAGGSTPADEKAEERFHDTYHLAETVRSGYVGSGEWLYGARGTNETFRVVAHANGEGFWGTDTWVGR